MIGVIAISFAFVPFSLHAQQMVNSDPRAYIVMDERTGAIIDSQNPDLSHPAASLTKLMTAIIFLEQRPRWTTRVKMLKADEVGGTRLRLKIGTVLTVKDLFFASLVGSANNSTHALMRVSGLTPKMFVHQMNTRSSALGLRATQFMDATGLDGGNRTTAREAALLARYALTHSDISAASGASQYIFRPVNRKLEKTVLNHNPVLGNHGPVIITAGKTGYIHDSKHNLVIRAMDANGRAVIVAVLGCSSLESAGQAALTLAKNGLQTAFATIVSK